jgi:predicted TIM-barrel fold metal-dependent hydrolase
MVYVQPMAGVDDRSRTAECIRNDLWSGSVVDLWPGSIVDADVHAVVPSLEALLPYLDDVWKQYFRERGWSGPSNAYTYPPALLSSARREWRPADGRLPASSVTLLQEHVLDPLDVDCAIVNCVYPIDLGHPDLSTAMARAVNDWLIAEWLDVDDRLRASIVLPSRIPAAMVAEIERVGAHPGFVQALLPVRSGRPYGNRIYEPVFAAIERHDLVAGIHWGGSNDQGPPTASGWPSWYVEEYVAEVGVFEAQLASLIAGGVFQTFPALRVSMLEIGFTWVPTWLWDMSSTLKGHRREVPWLDRLPFSLVRDHVRFSVAPLDADSPEELALVVGWLGSDELLMFATDYPHTHDDDFRVLFEAVPESMRPKLMAENARAWYRLSK